jgi:hypothetical protein
MRRSTLGFLDNSFGLSICIFGIIEPGQFQAGSRIIRKAG